jgi:hypothetical protein
LLTTARDGSISAISTSKARPPSLIGRALGRDPETAELHHRGRGARGALRAMMAIYIFKENYRFSN